MKNLITGLLIVCLLPSLTGCADLRDRSLTGHLWSSDLTSNHNSPAPSPNLQVFARPDHQDFLIQYDEARDKDSALKRRTYWLYANEPRIKKNRMPTFTKPEAAGSLQAILVETNSTPETLSVSSALTGAVLQADHRHFTLMSGGTDLGTFALPAYPDPASRATVVALTPVTVLTDTTVVFVVVGGVLGLDYLWGLCQSGAQFH